MSFTSIIKQNIPSLYNVLSFVKRMPMYCFCLYMILYRNQILMGTSTDTIALMFISGGLGDFILWLDSAKEYRKLFPDKTILLICDSPLKPIAEATCYFDKVYLLDASEYWTTNPVTLYKLRKRLSVLQAGKLIQCFVYRWLQVDYAASCIKAKEKITLDVDMIAGTRKQRDIARKMYKRIFYESNHKELRHILKINADFVRSFGHNFASSTPILPKFSSDIIPKVNYYVIHLGTCLTIKNWDIEKYVAVASYIHEKTGYTCCLCGVSAESALADIFIESVGSKIKLMNFVGKSSLTDFIELIRNAKFSISGDTSTVHLATAVRTPSICILGPWESGRYLPYDAGNLNNTIPPKLCCLKMPCSQCLHTMISKECRESIREHNKRLCIYNITVQDVLKQIENILKAYY